jgi:phosphoribosylformimino-5-aminoimidazole carboxamide ribotide isomerase
MAILPVLDVMHGRVVRGMGGRRNEYQPIRSCLTGSSVPRDVAGALHDKFGFREFYLADLDAIAGGQPAHAIYDGLHRNGHRLWVDAGIRTVDDARRLSDHRISSIVVGLETVDGPNTLAEICRSLGNDRVVFSLDLKEGHPLGNTAAWESWDSVHIARQAISAGVKRLLVLDLTRVGMGAGVGTEDLCSRLRMACSDLEITAGGGVRAVDDVRGLYLSGVAHVLVASALHDGRLTPQDVAGII